MQNLWVKYRNMSIQAKAAIWFAMCSILQKGISFITVPIFTRLIPTEQYGTYNIYLSWLQILTIITSFYLYHGVFNNGMTKFDKDRDGYISSMQGLTLTITAIVFCIYSITSGFWSEVMGLAPVFILLMFMEMAVTPALHFWSGRQRFESKYKRLVFITVTKSVANPILGIAMVLLSEDKALARVTSVVITEIVFCGFFMVRQFFQGKKFVDIHYWKYALAIAIPLIPHYLSGMILNQGDRIMIGKMIGKSEVAFYSLSYNIGMLVQIVTSAISNSFTPWMYQKIKANDFGGIKKTISSLLLLVSFVVFGLMLCGPELVLIFGPDEYANAVYVIPPVAASVFFIFLYNLLAIPQFYFEQTRFLAISSFAAAVINIILNYFFIKIFGYIAAGYTTLACYVLYSLGHYLVSKVVIKKHINGVSFFNEKAILSLSLMMIILGAICNILYSVWYVRYTLIVILFMIILLKRDKILIIINGIRKD